MHLKKKIVFGPCTLWVFQLDGRQWHFSRALSGKSVQIVSLDHRVLVYYCNTVIRQLDLTTGKSVLLNRWIH